MQSTWCGPQFAAELLQILYVTAIICRAAMHAMSVVAAFAFRLSDVVKNQFSASVHFRELEGKLNHEMILAR